MVFIGVGGIFVIWVVAMFNIIVGNTHVEAPVYIPKILVSFGLSGVFGLICLFASLGMRDSSKKY